jgi:uncharacterized protein YoxC
MTPAEAIQFAETWTKDMRAEAKETDMPLFHAMKALLDHTRRQSQDIDRMTKDVEELTLACQTLLRGNRRLQDELQRS